MARRSLRTVLLRTLAGWLQAGADAMRRRTGELAAGQPQDLGAVSASDQGITDRQLDEPPAHWIERVGRTGPPAHWLEYVQSRMAGLPAGEPPDAVSSPEFARPAESRTEGLPLRPDPRARSPEPAPAARVETRLPEQLPARPDGSLDDHQQVAPEQAPMGAEGVSERPPRLAKPTYQLRRDRASTPLPAESPAAEDLPASGRLMDKRPSVRLRPRPVADAEPRPSAVETEPAPARPVAGGEGPAPTRRAPAEGPAVSVPQPPPSAGETIVPLRRVLSWSAAEPAPEAADDAEQVWPALPLERPHEPRSIVAEPGPVSRRDRAHDHAALAHGADAGVERSPALPGVTPALPHAPERRVQARSVMRQPWEPVTDRWPALLDEEPVAAEDWESELRAWQRLRRLDREQRGVLWNELPF